MTAQELILVIEDDRALSVGLDINLTGEGYRVQLADDGESGLRLALESKPDLVVLDLLLPGMDGIEVLRELRRLDQHMPVIILSARAEEEDKIRGLGTGADDYVAKPFSLAELLARIDAALRRQRRLRDEGRRLRFADVEVDLAGRSVLKLGQAVTLTAREFDLLAYFVTNPGRARSRDALLATVWGYEYEGTARTIDNFVRALRVKLEPDPAAPRHFVTVHGVGYRFDP